MCRLPRLGRASRSASSSPGMSRYHLRNVKPQQAHASLEVSRSITQHHVGKPMSVNMCELSGSIAERILAALISALVAVTLWLCANSLKSRLR